MSAQSIKSVNFNTSGLATVGYQLLNSDKTVKQTRTTAGVSEIDATGIYCCLITFEDAWTGMILWDTGEAEPTYAIEDYNAINAGGGYAVVASDIWTQKEKEDLLKQIRTILKALKKTGLIVEKNAASIQEKIDSFSGKLEQNDLSTKEFKLDNEIIKKFEGIATKDIAAISENNAKMRLDLSNTLKGIGILGKAIIALMEAEEFNEITREVEDVLASIGG